MTSSWSSDLGLDSFLMESILATISSTEDLLCWRSSYGDFSIFGGFDGCSGGGAAGATSSSTAMDSMISPSSSTSIVVVRCQITASALLLPSFSLFKLQSSLPVGYFLISTSTILFWPLG